MITINNKTYDAENGELLIDVCRRNNIDVPTLCYLKNVCHDSNCRICMCEINGRLAPACSCKVSDGMVVVTESEKINKSRTTTLNLIMSKHHYDCQNCIKDGKCKLQKLFEKYNIKKGEYSDQFSIDKSSPCIVRDNNKCILCGRCINVCKYTQNVHALTKQQRGFDTFVGCSYDAPLKQSPCVGCGQCVLVCPTGALCENSEILAVNTLLSDKNNYVTCQIAPSVRVSLAEEFGEKIGAFDEGRMVACLKQLGFEKVFDVNMGADFTVIEEAQELLERIKEGKRLPLFSSCCPAWFKYMQNFYPDHLEHLSSCKSPTEMLGAIVKNFYSKKQNIDKQKIKVVGIMPCTAKKGEKERGADVDAVITTRELAKMIKDANIDYKNITPQEWDKPLSYYSGAGLIFGVTGGVTEAVLRYVCNMLGETKVDFDEVRKSNGRKEVEVTAGDIKLKLCVVNGLDNAHAVMEDIVLGKVKYDFVEVMACPGGCVNGGGQAFVDYDKTDIEKVKLMRSSTIYNVDAKMKVRSSNANEQVNDIYKEFFIPSKSLAHKLLHYSHKK